MTVEYKCIDVYKKPENPMEWLPCPRCGLRPLVWEFDNGRDAEVSGFITSWLSFGNRKAIIGAAEMRKCLDKIFDLAIDERLK